ncbi:MAG TPA: transglycosylase domain-containing protein [Thermomicrobiales bacterium]|nr:transglycosylase domain-containing protein [Thermomicrobiales bacterium]
MRHGRISRASHRYPDAKRRAARYARTRAGQRATTVPPHLLPGITGRQGSSGTKLRLLLLAANVVLGALLLATGAFVISTVAAVSGTMAAYRQVNEGLPNAAGVAVDNFQTTRIYDRNGELLQEVDDPTNPYGGWRTFVTLDQVSPYLIDATVAAEDGTFWTHHGVEPIAIVRGAFINVGGTGSSGGSTVTQQLVRALFPEKIGYDISYARKGKEALAAVEMERNYSKTDIMTMYLNLIFYGSRSYGIEAASQTYFEKHASELTLPEAALLAGLPQRPTDYNPTINLDLAKQRQDYVLDQMVKLGYITRAEAREAFDTPLNLRDGQRTGLIHHAPHFVNYVGSYIKEHLGEEAYYRGGLQITTTIDIELQAEAEEIMQRNVANLDVYNARNGSMVAMVPWSGEILAMVGSANFEDETIEGQNNIAVSQQQPGSAIKPIVYAAAFENGWNPATVVLDSTFRRETPGQVDPVTGEPVKYYEPQNYTGNFYGAVTVRTALANSLNIPAVKATEYVGPQAVMDVARRMGMKDSFTGEASDYGLSIGLGGAEVQLLELTNAYATLANMGEYVPANPIMKIADSQGNVLYDIDREEDRPQPDRAIKAEYAYQITDILTDNDARALLFGRENLFGETQDKLDRPTAAKSGTTNDVKDIWTMGYTTDLTVGVWIGNTNNDPLEPLDGIQGAGPIWSETMLLLHQDSRFSDLLLGPEEQPLPKEFPRPEGIYEGQVCTANGHAPVNNAPTRTDLLVRDEGPALRCDQLSGYERKELDAALKDIQSNSGKYASGAIDSIRKYDQATRGQYSGPSIQSKDDDKSRDEES